MDVVVICCIIAITESLWGGGIKRAYMVVSFLHFICSGTILTLNGLKASISMSIYPSIYLIIARGRTTESYIK